MSSLPIRVVYALTAVFVVLGTIYFFDYRGTILLCLVMNFLALRELVRLIFPIEHNSFNRFRTGFLVSIGLAALSSALVPLETSLVVVFLGMLFFIFGALLVLGNMDRTDALGEGIARGIMGFFYLGTLPSFIYQILKKEHGVFWFLSLILIVSAGDTFAFFVGKLFGKHKVLPKISPAKSWEGSLGGLFGSLLAGGLSVQFLLPHYAQKTAWFLVLSVFIGGAAQLGDFFESLLKRLANVKDSGSLIPGHGGVLDRIDGILFAGPVMFFGIQLLDWILSVLSQSNY